MFNRPPAHEIPDSPARDIVEREIARLQKSVTPILHDLTSALDLKADEKVLRVRLGDPGLVASDQMCCRCHM